MGGHGLDQIQWALAMDETGPVEVWPITPGEKNGKVSVPLRQRHASRSGIWGQARAGPGRDLHRREGQDRDQIATSLPNDPKT